MNINEYEITIGVLKKGGDFEKQFNQIAKIVELPYLNKSIKELFKYYILKKHVTVDKSYILFNTM